MEQKIMKVIDNIIANSESIAYAAAGVFFGVILLLIGLELRKVILAAVIMREKVTLQLIPGENQNEHNLEDSERFIKYLHGLMQDYTSVNYEIAADGATKEINFYINVPERYANSIKDRLFSLHKDMQIFEVEDYFPKKYKWKELLPIRIFLKKDFMLPIKREISILPEILSNMTDLEYYQKIYFQVNLRKDQRWKKKAVKRFKQAEENSSKAKKLSELDVVTNFLGSGFESTGKKGRIEKRILRVSSEKLKEIAFKTTITVTGVYAKSKAKAISSVFHELNDENAFRSKIIWIFRKRYYRKMRKRKPIRKSKNRNILSAAELAGFTFAYPGGNLHYPEITRNAVSVLPPPLGAINSDIKFGEVQYRGKKHTVGLKIEDMLRHVNIEGKTGTGKSGLILLLFQSIIKKYGCLIADPHKDLYMDAMKFIPDERIKDTVLLDFTDVDNPVPLNVFYLKNRDNISIQERASKILDAFKKHFSDCWGARTEHIFRNTFKTVLEYPSDIYDVKFMLTSEEYRCKVIPKIKNPNTKSFWINEFYDKFNPGNPAANKIKTEFKNAILSPLNKLGKFLDNEYVNACMVQPGCIDARKHMDEKKIVLANLDKSKLGDAGDFLGSLLLSEYRYSAFTRQEISKSNRVPFGILYDEFENVVSSAKEDITSILEELRKYGLFIAMIHQYLDQIKHIQSAVFGNVGSIITFRMGEEDAEKLAKVYGYGIKKENISRLPNRFAMAKLLVNGYESRPFIFRTLDLPLVSEEEVKLKREKLYKMRKEMFLSGEEVRKYYFKKLNSIYQKEEKRDNIIPIIQGLKKEEENTNRSEFLPFK